MSEIVWLNSLTTVEVAVNEHGRARLEFGPAPYGVVLVGDRCQLHTLIIEVDNQLTRLPRL
jgi:hypothetical protein